MSGIFPNATDGGLSPNSNDPANPARAYPPVTAPVGTAALYYGNGCDVRLRPEVVNSLISETEAVVDIAKLAYNPTRQTNLQLAVRYLIQRGLPRSAPMMQVAPNRYTIALDPVSTAYNDFMTLSVVPNVTNTGAVKITLDGRSELPLLRNDGQNLYANDITAGHGTIIMFYQGNWYVVSLVISQIAGAVNITMQVIGTRVWIRTSGSGTFEVPPDVYVLREVEVTGGGGGGGGSSGLSGPVGGGGNAGCTIKGCMFVTPGQLIPWSVGIGGYPGTGATDGGDGANSQFGTWQAGSGYGGRSNTGNVGRGWGPSTGDFQEVYFGQQSFAGRAHYDPQSGESFLNQAGHGGGSTVGGQGGQGSNNGGTDGNPGLPPGGGGGGGSTYPIDARYISKGGPGSGGRIMLHW